MLSVYRRYLLHNSTLTATLSKLFSSQTLRRFWFISCEENTRREVGCWKQEAREMVGTVETRRMQGGNTCAWCSFLSSWNWNIDQTKIVWQKVWQQEHRTLTSGRKGFFVEWGHVNSWKSTVNLSLICREDMSLGHINKGIEMGPC